MTKPRVLVTGGRSWKDEKIVEAALLVAYQDLGPFVLVHGDCPTGADAIADFIAHQRGWEVERHPADWKSFGRAAGPKRNREMARSGIDRVLAFLMPNSKGTANCLDECVKAKIVDIRTFEFNGKR